MGDQQRAEGLSRVTASCSTGAFLAFVRRLRDGEERNAAPGRAAVSQEKTNDFENRAQGKGSTRLPGKAPQSWKARRFTESTPMFRLLA